jgi:hypothetical protein
VPHAELERLARLEDAPADNNIPAALPFGNPEDLPFFRVVSGYTPAPPNALPTAAFGKRVDVLLAGIPAGGTMSARAVARMYAALLGEVSGVRLVSPERLREITAVAISGDDQVLGMPIVRGLGYDIGSFEPLDSPTLIGMAGSEGSAAYADTASGIAIALTKHRISSGDYTSFNQIGAIVAAAVAGT